MTDKEALALKPGDRIRLPIPGVSGTVKQVGDGWLDVSWDDWPWVPDRHRLPHGLSAAEKL